MTFLSSHNLYKDAKVEIIMPPGLSLPVDGTKIEVTPLGGSTRATEGVIKGTTTVVIENFVSVTENVAPYKYTFALSEIANQLSAKDAGGYTITTYYKASDGEYYVVDTQQWFSSFTATTGLLSADNDLLIDDPTNYLDDAVYTFTFSEDSMVPAGGYIKLDFPEDVKFV